MPIDHKFEATAIRYFTQQVGFGSAQRIDGVAAFSPLSEFWFWRWRLNRMVRRGLLQRIETRSIWRSCDGMPAYGLPWPPERVIYEGTCDADGNVTTRNYLETEDRP